MTGICHVLSIGDLFQPESIFIDKDNDGYPDELNLTIGIDPRLEDSAVWSGVLNLVARLTFEIVTLPLHLLRSNLSVTNGQKQLLVLAPGSSPPGYTEALSNGMVFRADADTVYLAGSCGKTLEDMLNALAMGDCRDNASPVGTSWDCLKIVADSGDRLDVYSSQQQVRSVPISSNSQTADTAIKSSSNRTASRPIDLLDLTGEHGLYEIPADSPRSRILKACLSLSQPRIANELGLALGQVVSLLVLEATDITLPIVFSQTLPDREIIIRIVQDTTAENLIRLQNTRKGQPTEILASGTAAFLAQTLKSWFGWAFLKHGPGSEPADSFRQHIAEFRDLLSGTGYWGRWAHVLIDQTAESKWEQVSIPEANRQKINQALQSLGFSNTVKAFDPKVLSLQKKWIAETENILDQVTHLPIGNGKLQGMILTSKPLSVRQELQQKLEGLLSDKGYQPSLTVLNSYKPGLCWLLEQVLPTLKKCQTISQLEITYQPFPTGAMELELRSRWLQELFPGPDLLVRELKLDSQQVLLLEAADQATIYRLLAKDSANCVIFEHSFSPRTVAMDYLCGYPEIGSVHPCTSGILLQSESGIVLDQDLPSDRISFWTEFQSVWLPELEKRMKDRMQQESCDGQAAFWKEIRIEVAIDETESRLDFGDERIGPMEALHEDLYFTMLDFFARFAARHQLPPEIQLGQVIPQVYAKSPEGKPSATLTAIPLPWATTPKAIPRFADQQSQVVALSKENENWFVDLSCGNLGFNPEERTRLITLAAAWGYQAAWRDSVLRLHRSFNPVSKNPYRPRKATMKIPRDRMLTAAEVASWLTYLETLPHLNIWTAASSWQGRPIRVVEAVLNPNGKRISLVKSRLLKPTLLFNARHHANEISSTSATLELAHFLSTTPEGNELLRQANVIMIPMENPDGVALLETLLPACPDHKLHAARYNALGSEFYAEYFKDRPRFPEAFAKTRAWQRWLPEIVVDQHGVPGHEWDQPFSGYAPYRFREFWIPRTFAYVYIPFIRETSHPNHPAALRIADALSQAMSQETAIVQSNRELSERYRHYAYDPEPDVFPASQGESLLVLPLQERVNSTNGAVRFPDITKSEIIVELPDEVVAGKQFALCLAANHRIQHTLIRLSQRPTGRLEIKVDLTSGTCRLHYPEPI